MDNQMPEGAASSTYSNLSMSGTNPGHDSQLEPGPVQARPQQPLLNYAAGKKIYMLLAICLIIALVRISLFDVGLHIGGNAARLQEDKVYLEDAKVRYKRHLTWCAVPDLISLILGMAAPVLSNRCNQNVIVVLWAIFCVLSLEPLGYDIYNAWESYGHPKFGQFIWFFILLVLIRVGVLVVSVIFLLHLVDTVRKNRNAREGVQQNWNGAT